MAFQDTQWSAIGGMFNAGPQYIAGRPSKALSSTSFKEVLKETYDKIDEMSNQLSSDEPTITIENQTFEKTNASASFIVSQHLNDYEQLITIMMDILNKFKDLDKSLGQSMSKS